MKYELIRTRLAKSYPIGLCCKVLGVSRSGYYNWQKRKVCRRQLEEKRLLELINKHHKTSRGRYGLFRILEAIGKEGIKVNRKRIHRIMKKYGIRSKTARKFKLTTKQDKKAEFSPNLLNGCFTGISEDNQVWTSDITYIWTKQGWLYLAVVQDIFNREMIGWSVMESLSAEIVKNALKMAIKNRMPQPGIIFHSDRGSQYTSSMVRHILHQYGFRQSMSSKGSCYDNAITETFFSTLKKELVYLTVFETKEQAKCEIFEFIEIFYNRKRLHSSLGYMSPVDYRMKFRNELNKKVA